MLLGVHPLYNGQAGHLPSAVPGNTRVMGGLFVWLFLDQCLGAGLTALHLVHVVGPQELD